MTSMMQNEYFPRQQRGPFDGVNVAVGDKNSNPTKIRLDSNW